MRIAVVSSMVPAVTESLHRLDIVAFVPHSDQWPVEMEADGIRRIVELVGSRGQPPAQLEQAIAEM